MKKDPQADSSNRSNVNRFQDCCPLKKKTFPTEICEHGLTRARWSADHSGYLAFEEKNAPGCPFGMLTEDRHSYCFFKFMADLDRPLTEEEISRMLCLSKDQIKRIVETASIKLKSTDIMKELKELHESGHLFEETSDISDDIYFPDQFNPDSVQADGVVEDTVEADVKKR